MSGSNAGAKARLVQLADFARPDGGSFVPLLIEVCEAAAARGWSVEVGLFDSARDCAWVADLEAAGARVRLAPESLRTADRGLRDWLLAELAGGPGRTVLHSHFTGFDVASALARMRDRRLRTVWHVHSPLERTAVQLARTVVKMGGLSRLGADALLCPAPNIREDLLRRGAPRKRVFFFPTAVAIEDFPAADAEARARARRELDLDPEALVLLHFGWHWELKGGELFLRTVARLAERRGDVVALERGGDQRYASFADGLGIGARVRVQEPVRDPVLLHAAADVQIASSKREGMAYAVLESLCVGTPVVATDIPGHSFLGAEIDACRIAGHSPEQLASAVEETLARTPQAVAAETAQARAWIADNLAAPTVAGRLVDVYEALLADRRPQLPWNP